MKVGDQLDKPQKDKLNQKNKPMKKRNKQRFSRKEIHDLMGINRDTYKRRGGAIRRKN